MAKVDKRTKKPTNLDKKGLMLKALEHNLNIVTDACKQVGINRATHYDWLEKDPDYKLKVSQIDELVLDFVESALYKLIKSENPTSIIFFLKTKGKHRGYSENEAPKEITNEITIKHQFVSNREQLKG